MRQYLIVANETLGEDKLLATVQRCIAAGGSRFFIVAPATPSQDHLTWTEGEAQAQARQRLASALTHFDALGATVEGDVGDGSPMEAIRDAMRARSLDEIILVTHAPGISRWLRQDLPRRVARAFGLPVTHISPAGTGKAVLRHKSTP